MSAALRDYWMIGAIRSKQMIVHNVTNHNHEIDKIHLPLYMHHE